MNTSSRAVLMLIVGLLVGGLVTWWAFSAKAPVQQDPGVYSSTGRELSALTALVESHLVQSWWVVLAGEVQSVEGDTVTLDFNGTEKLSFKVNAGTGYLLPPEGATLEQYAQSTFSLADLKPGDRVQVQARVMPDGMYATFVQRAAQPVSGPEFEVPVTESGE